MPRLSLAAVGLVAALVEPSLAQATRPALQQLSRETAALYRQVAAGVVKVQLPPPRWVSEWAARENPINHWKGLNPDVARQFDEHKAAPGNKAQHIGAVIVPHDDKAPATAPASQPSPATGGGTGAWHATPLPGGQSFLLEPRNGLGEGSVLMLGARGLVEDHAEALLGGLLGGVGRGNFAPNNLGLVLDSAGHLLVPMFVEKEVMDRTPAVRVMVGSGTSAEMLNAKFVGSDWLTNVTVLQLDRPLGQPLRLAPSRPEEGSLVMVLAPAGNAARLALWTGGQLDGGVVVNMDAAVAGFARYGQFVSAAACAPVVDQLVRFGKVTRATLGVAVTEVGPDDPAREGPLARRPAMRVEGVKEQSAADRGGVRQGDLILSLAGEAVGDVDAFRAAISGREGRTELKVLRGGQELTLPVELRRE